MLRALQAAPALALRACIRTKPVCLAGTLPLSGKLSRSLSTATASLEEPTPTHTEVSFSTLAHPISSEKPLQAWLTRLDGTKIGLINVSNHIFGAQYRPDILHQVVVWQLAKRRAGLAKVKGRSEVQGSTRKIYPQKGRGAARHGSIRAPIFVGGGRVHGPHPRSYDYTLPKKIRRLGLRVALSAKFAQGDLTFIDKVAVQNHKTKYLHQDLAQRGLSKSCMGLIVGPEEIDENLRRASLNLPYAQVMACTGINVYDCLRYKKVMLSMDALHYLEGFLGGH